MTRALSRLILLGLLGLALLCGQSAYAQSPVPLVVGGSLVYGGMTFSVSSCTYTNEPINPTRANPHPSGDYNGTCGLSNDLYLAPDPSGPAHSVIIEALSGSSQVPIFSYTCGLSGGCNVGSTGTFDLSVQLNVTTAAGHTVSSAIQTASFTAPSALATSNPGDGHATETINSSLCTLTSNLGTATPPSCTFTPQNSLVVQKDLGITVNGLANGSTLALNSVVETFAHAPEPSSLAVLASGLFVLLRARRKRSLA